MANYVFESMTAAQAASFASTDTLIFLSATAANLGVVDAPSNFLNNESLTLTSGSTSLVFSAAQLSVASQTGNLTFVNSDTAAFGTNSADTVGTAGASAGHGAAIYGFAGNDTLVGTVANDTISGGNGDDTITANASGVVDTTSESDYFYGGSGNDSITGGLANDHLYGNSLTSVQGAADGNDTLNAGDGNDYVNGNAGNDIIDGGNGNDRLFGGNGDDSITGGNGFDSINGQVGNDTIDGGNDNDTIRGGQGNDILTGGNGDDQLFGDLGNDSLTGGNGNDVLQGGEGNDTLIGGLGFDTLTGGNGVDTFSFAATLAVTGSSPAPATNDAAFTVTSGVYSTDEITDFTHGTDKIALLANAGATARTPTAIDFAQSGATFTTVAAAQTYAQQLLDNDTTHSGNEVAAIQVGSDTYLFYSAQAVDGGTIDSIIKLDGITPSSTTISVSDFV